jgi:RHS repeat-associated protein
VKVVFPDGSEAGFTYDAFGKLIAQAGSTPNAYLYRGERFDADLGLYHLRARSYDPNRGRFTTVDPFPGFTDDPASLHRYLYANSDPVNFIDPSGLDGHRSRTRRYRDEGRRLALHGRAAVEGRLAGQEPQPPLPRKGPALPAVWLQEKVGGRRLSLRTPRFDAGRRPFTS